MIEHGDGVADQPRGRLVEPAVKLTVRSLSTLRCSGVRKYSRRSSGALRRRLTCFEVALQRLLARGGMHALVVVLLDPFQQPLVEIRERERLGQQGKQLRPYGLEQAFDFPFPLGGIGGGVQERDAQPPAGVAQRVVAEGRPVVDVKLPRQTPTCECLDEAILETLQTVPQR